jgi:hypothetical protein
MVFKFNFDGDMKGEVNVRLSGTNTVTSTALSETLKLRKLPKRPQGSTLEEYELGPEPPKNPGPCLPWETSSCATYGEPLDCKGHLCSLRTTPSISFVWRRGRPLELI